MKESIIQVYGVKEPGNLNVIMEGEDERPGRSYSLHWSLDKCFCIFTNNGIEERQRKIDWLFEWIFKRKGLWIMVEEQW